MSYLGKFIKIITSPDEPDLETFHSVLNEVITSAGECAPADADDIELIKQQFSDETASLVAVHASSLRWLSQILINQCITHFDTKHQQMLVAFLDRLLNTESQEYVDVLYAVRHYFASVSKLLQGAVFRKPLNALNARLAHHHITENHANKLMAFLKAGPSDAYVGETSVFLSILKGQAKESSPFQLKSTMKDEYGRCTPFALMAMKSLSMADFIFYVKQVKEEDNFSANKVVLTPFHREALHQALDKLNEARDLFGVAQLLTLFRVLGMGIDAKEQRGRDILMAFFLKRLAQEADFSFLLMALNTNLDACFDMYQSLTPQRHIGPADEKYIAFLKDRLQWSPKIILKHLTLKEKQSLPAEFYLQLAQDAGLTLRDIRATLTEKQSQDLVEINAKKIESSASLLEIRGNVLRAHELGIDSGVAEYQVLNFWSNLDKETALLLFTSKALQAQSRDYFVHKTGECEKSGDLFYYGLNRIIFTALLALDPAVYERPGNEHLGFTSFQDAFQYWMITVGFRYRDRSTASVSWSYEDAVFFDNYNPRDNAESRGQRYKKLCTDSALEARLKAASVHDTPETLAGDTPIDHGQIATMFALKKIGFRYDRHGVKHAFQAILDMRPHLKNAVCDGALLAVGYYPGRNLLENIFMSHQSNGYLSQKTKEFKALQEARKKRPMSSEGLPLLRMALDRHDFNLMQAISYLVFHLEPSDEDALSVVKKHLWVLRDVNYRHDIEKALDSLSAAQLELLKTRLVKYVLSDDALKAQVSAGINEKYILLTILHLKRATFGDRFFDEHHPYSLVDTEHWKALNAYLNPASPPALLTKFGKFAGVPAEKASGDASLSMRYEKPKPGN